MAPPSMQLAMFGDKAEILNPADGSLGEGRQFACNMRIIEMSMLGSGC